MNEEFYVGYVPKAPAVLAKRVTRIATVLVLAGLAAGAVLIFDQPPFAASKFEYGEYREYSGVIEEWPYPMLRTSDAAFLLVAPGKHGLAGSVRGFQGKSIRLKGSLIERGSDRMLEVVPGSMTETSLVRVQSTTGPVDLGSVTLRGEIVDSKCYLGVMNPGNGKVHRDCAVRCISGGIPPAFVVKDSSGVSKLLMLSNAQRLAEFVSEPVQISGRFLRSGGMLTLEADPGSIRRLGKRE